MRTRWVPVSTIHAHIGSGEADPERRNGSGGRRGWDLNPKQQQQCQHLQRDVESSVEQ